MQAIKPAACYFALVFGTGFVLGPIRILWLTPRIGVRAAELTELPLMLIAVYFAARFVVRRFHPAPPALIPIGLTALAMQLAAFAGMPRLLALSRNYSRGDLGMGGWNKSESQVCCFFVEQ